MLAQQIAIGYRIDFLGTTEDASLIHLHAGLLLAIAVLETDRRVLIGALLITAAGWAVRQWQIEPGRWSPLLWGASMWVLVGAWTRSCAHWAGWPRDPSRRRLGRRDLARLAVFGLLLYPAGWALLGGTIVIIERPAIALSSVFQMFFAKQFGVAVVTLPLVVAWTERQALAPRHRAFGWIWPVLLILGLGLSLWASQHVRAGLAGSGAVLMDYRFGLFVVLAWFVLRLPPRRSMPALSAALFCLVYAVSDTAEYGNTAVGLFNLLHLAAEVNILLLAMLYLWVISRDRRELAQRLADDSLRDTITGLPNLRALRRRMRWSPPERRELGFLLLDQTDSLLTGYGLDTQAMVMESLAARLSDLAETYSLGTGQFALVPVADADDDIWERLISRVEHAEFMADGQPVRLLPYLGVASLPAALADSVDTVDTALLSASHLAFDARQHGEVRPRYSDADDSRLRSIHRQQLQDAATALSCLRNERLVLHFQPIRRLEQIAEPALTISGEVLCRLRGEDGQLIPPVRFMRPIEAAGRGAELDLAVIKALFRLLRRYPEALPYCERIAINLTGQSLASMSFQIELRTLLADSPLPLSALCFEVTETAAIYSTSMAARLLRDLRARGCQIAIDDFGTGMQSFARLKELPADIIKIDGSFIRNVAQRGSDHALVKATVAVARVFGAETVAEFVQDTETAHCLEELEVDWVQGDLYAPPRPLSEVLAEALPRELQFAP